MVCALAATYPLPNIMCGNLLCFGGHVKSQLARFRSELNATGTIVRELEGLTATTDRRVRRTRELLRSALFSLILERGYERISVQDILDRADVGRSTFYALYRDKDDLLRSGFEDLRSALATETAGDGNAAHGKTEFLQPVLAVLQHVEAHRHLWKPLAAKGGANLVIRILRENLSDLVRQHFRSQLPGWKGDQTQLEAAVQFVVSALIGVITWWLDDDVPYSAEEIYLIFRRLTTQGVKRFLGA
jgi:AcrR family transcriptional regulator